MTGVWIGAISAIVTAGTAVAGAERSKKATKKALKLDERQAKKQTQLAGMQDMAMRRKAEQEQEKLKTGGSGVKSTLLTGSKTLG